MCGQGKSCEECSMGPCGPGGDFMRRGQSRTHCIYCGKDFPYGSRCGCTEDTRTQKEKDEAFERKFREMKRPM